MSVGGYLDVEYVVTKDTATIMLKRLEDTISPAGIERFLLETAAPWLASRAADRFASEGDDASGAWAALSPATETIRAWGREKGLWGVGDKHPINVRTGDLERFITSGIGVIESTGAGGVNLKYPGGDVTGGKDLAQKVKVAQQGGTQANAHPTVPRPVLALDRVDLEYLLTELRDLIYEGRAL